MSEKQPQAGEWWQKDDTRLCIIGTKKNGLTVGETECGSLIPFMSIHGWQHLPDCDSFEWQPEVYPQYWTTKDTDSTRDVAFVELKQGGDWVQHYRDGMKYLMTVVPFQKKGRTQLTKEQAEALLPPVESPDDWVTQDRVPARPGIDERAYKSPRNDYELWQDAGCIKWDKPAMHGSEINGDTLILRCRRKDLPPRQSPKRVTVRLIGRRSGTVRWQELDESFDAHDIEIKHDGYKFYFEVQQ